MSDQEQTKYLPPDKLGALAYMTVKWESGTSIGLIDTLASRETTIGWNDGNPRVTWIRDGQRICLDISAELVLAMAKWMQDPASDWKADEHWYEPGG